LKARGAECLAIDPQADLNEVPEAERNDLPFRLVTQAAEAFEGADAAVLITEWPEFRALDWPSLAARMRRPLLIDTKNFLAKEFQPIANAIRFWPGHAEAREGLP
jgi:UDPglucose 6-dehydrogenase